MKKVYSFLAATAIVGASAYALAPAVPDAAGTPKRAPISTEQKARIAAHRAPVMGGTNGDKPLYGFVEAYSYGVLEGWAGVATIDIDGNHQKVSSYLGDTQTSCYFTRDGEGYVMAVAYNNGVNVAYKIYNATTWEVSTGWQYTLSSEGVMPFDLAQDPQTGRVYGFFLTDTGYGDTETGKLGYIDVNNLNVLDAITHVADMNTPMRGMSFDSTGQLYGLGFDNNLYKINKLNGALTTLGAVTWEERPGAGDAGFCGGIWGHESAEFDWDTDELYFAGMDDLWDTFVYKLDVNTLQASLVADFGYESYNGSQGTEIFSGIFFKQEAPVAAATPAAVSNYAATALGTQLKANVEFDLPGTDTDGNALSGDVDWTVTDGENTLANGSAAAGAHVSTVVELPEGGFVNIAAIASLGGTNSAPASARLFIGPDTPVLPGIPDVFPDGNEAAIVWEAPYSLNGGNLDAITYRVVRMPDGLVVAEAATETTVTDKIDTDFKTRFTYEVTPLAGAIAGETVATRPAYLGKFFAMPHTDTFDDAVLFNEYPAIDANRDGNTWWIDTKREAAVYSATQQAKADDYLCIGPFDLVAGNTYSMSMTADGHNNIENVAAYVGTDPSSAESFTHCIVPTTLINPIAGAEHLSGTFVPETSGIYYFGIQACSDAYAQNLYIYDVKITGVSGEMPAAPEVSNQPTAAGPVFTITVPAKTIDGKAAANATAVRIYRDNKLVEELTEGVTDGATLTFADNTEGVSTGNHIYTFSAVNAAGEGELNTLNVFIGLDMPGQPRNMRVYEDLNTMGLIHITWEAPTTGANGGYIDASNVNYIVDWLSFGAAGSGEKSVGTALSVDIQIPADAITKQDIVAFSVNAYNASGDAGRDSRATRSCYYGPAFDMPLFETFGGNKASSGTWSGEDIDEDAGLFESLWDYSDRDSQDAAGSMMQLTTTVENGGYRMRTPRIDISKANEPILVFHHKFTADATEFLVEIAIDDQPMKTLRTIDLAAAKPGEWTRHTIDLSEFKNAKYVQFGFSGRASKEANAFCCIDNINIVDKAENNLRVLDVQAPAKANINDALEISLTFRNLGTKDLAGKDYKLRLIKNGKEAETLNGVDLDAFENATIALTDFPMPTDPAMSVYSVAIDFASDKYPADNTSKEVSVRIVTSHYPTPTDLNAQNIEGVTLSWTAPDKNLVAGQSVTDDFESYEAFAISNIGDWTTYDVDGARTVIMATVLGPYDYPHIGEAMAWQVMNPAAANILHNAWYARSGEQMLVSFQACRDGGRDVVSNDWLVSPELNGAAQTISFYANTGMSAYAPEIIDIYVSSTGNAIDDFKLLVADIEIQSNAEMAEYVFAVPAGTKHFAIVHKSFDKFALLVDDITYIPAGSKQEEVTLMGYNIYRDGQRINTVGAEATSFVDKNVEVGQSYSYNVTALWDKGESALSNTASINVESGIADMAVADIRVSASNRTIRIAGAAGLPVAVYTIAGQTIAATTGAALTEVPVAVPGVYIVRAGAATQKIIVR